MYIPEAIHEAAEVVTNFFDKEGVEGWQYGGLADRRLVGRDTHDRVMKATHSRSMVDKCFDVSGVEVKDAEGKKCVIVTYWVRHHSGGKVRYSEVVYD